MDDIEDTAAYRIYVTDCLAALCQTNMRYYDMVYPGEKVQQEDKTCEEICQDLVARHGWTINEGGQE